jgi:hypothetical protein
VPRKFTFSKGYQARRDGSTRFREEGIAIALTEKGRIATDPAEFTFLEGSYFSWMNRCRPKTARPKRLGPKRARDRGMGTAGM